VPHEEITLPDRVFNPDYERNVLPPELYVPSNETCARVAKSRS